MSTEFIIVKADFFHPLLLTLGALQHHPET